jgi:competence protein ComEC
MQDSGLTHLVAVSGANVTLLVVVLLQLLGRLRLSRWLLMSVVCAFLALFVLLVRAEPSVLRAATMAVIALVAVTAALPKSGLPILFSAATILLLWYPWLAQSWGFALSCLATFGLLLWAGQLRAHRSLSRLPNWLADALAVTLAAQFAVFILLIALGGSWSPLSIIANAFAAPLASWVMVVGLLFTLLASIAPNLAQSLAFLVVWPAHAITVIANVTSALIAKFSVTLPWPSGRFGIAIALALLAIGIAVRIFPRVSEKLRTNEAMILAMCLAVLLWQPIDLSLQKWPNSNWVMVSCDVGQGDSTVLRTGKNSAVVVDVGGDEKLVAQCLDALHIKQIDLLVLTHFHADHVGGLAGALKEREVLRSVATSYRQPKATVDFVTALLDVKGLKLERLNYPAELKFGDLSLTCLWPARDFADQQSPINNSSIALLAQIQGLRILLPGDLEPQAQTAMLKNWASSRIDVLKIAHHGSRYQALEFATALAPRLATISVGKDNDYGHPAPETILMYSLLGTHILRTDELGSIAIYGDPLAYSTQKVTGSWQTR